MTSNPYKQLLINQIKELEQFKDSRNEDLKVNRKRALPKLKIGTSLIQTTFN